MQLTGQSLGERQKELNNKVNEAASNNIDFDAVEAEDETDDLDKLFKIDLASKYKNIGYIIEVLKCGDSLYITRALKCIWLYGNEFSNLINPDYLHRNVIPFMSSKMKKKMLTSISMHVRDENRAVGFYTYCTVTAKLPHIADKFLIFTPDSFKLNLINNEIVSLNSLRYSEENLVNFFRNSFQLLDAYLSKVKDHRHDCLHALRHLYLISDVKYLDLLEKYYVKDETNCKFNKRLGLRTSKDIIKKHKNRFNNHLLLYVNILNISIFVKYTTNEEAKEYAVRLMPNNCSTFWDLNFCETYDFIINILPFEDRHEFVKKKFTNKYIGEQFEMDVKFYKLKYFRLLSVDEKEAWALRHISDNKELLGVDNDFIWYKFVNFEQAFKEIKKYISIAPNLQKEMGLLLVLVESTRNQGDVEKLLNFYMEEYMNENIYNTREFLAKVVEINDVFDFDKKCWEVFEKLICSLNDVYNLPVHNVNIDEAYRYIGLFYHMLHKNELPDGLQMFINTDVCFWDIKRSEVFGKLNKERQNQIYEYMLQFYVDKITPYENQTYDETVQEGVMRPLYFIVQLLKQFGKKEEVDCPEVAKKYMELDPDYYDHKWPRLTQNDLLRDLKEDIGIIVCKFNIIEHNSIERSVRRFKLKQFLKKLKIYFFNDFAQEVLQLFIDMFSHHRFVFRPKRLTSAVVFAIFHLADEDYKREFMAEHVPSDAKIDDDHMRYTMGYRREAIRRFVCYSRPPISLSALKPYLSAKCRCQQRVCKNRRVCMPMINCYMSSLPLPFLIEFVETLLSIPVYFQCHGLRMAFRLFDSRRLKNVILEAWEKSRDETLRLVIYTYLHKHVANNDDELQNEMFEVLKTFTLDLSDKDHNNIISLMLDIDKTHENFRGKYLQVVWDALAKFADTSENVVRKVNTVNNMKRNYNLMEKSFREKFVNEHVYTIQEKAFVLTTRNHYYCHVLCHLNAAKWDLVATYFTKLHDDEETRQWILESLKLVIKQFIEMWDCVERTKNVPQTFFGFVQTLMNKNFECDREKFTKNSLVFETILKEIQNSLPPQQIYKAVWTLRLTIIAIKALHDENRSLQDIASTYGREIGNLVRKSVDSNAYETSFFENIVLLVKVGLSNIVRMTENNLQMLYDLHALVGIELLTFGILETELLATEMLSFHSSSDSHSNLLTQLKMIEKEEVKSIVYQKCLDGGAILSLPTMKEEVPLVYNKNLDNTCVFEL